MRVISFAKEGIAPLPTPPAVFKPSMLAIEKTHNVVSIFAVRESCVVILKGSSEQLL